ncbi:hypothetical protein [Sorangium sp. So ce1335]|uniref:hypothetical protein n=1 Tax=Sorangium sp. So ce1335 TaxID=3133335 RepID=UPI003F5EF964
MCRRKKNSYSSARRGKAKTTRQLGANSQDSNSAPAPKRPKSTPEESAVAQEPHANRGDDGSQRSRIDRSRVRQYNASDEGQHEEGSEERRESLDAIFNAAIGKEFDDHGSLESVELNGQSAQMFMVGEGAVLFHGASKVFNAFKPGGQIYLSNYDTAQRYGNGSIMIVKITERLKLIDLSNEDTVRGLLRSNDDDELRAHLQKVTGLSIDAEGMISGTFKKGTVAKSDNFLCAWARDGANCHGFVRFPVNGKGFPEVAINDTSKCAILGYWKNAKLFPSRA